MKRRVFLVVLDSFGIGYEPDAADFGDVGSNTLATIMKSEYYNTPNMKKLGLFNIDGVEAESKEENVVGAYGRMQERSRGKDTTVGTLGNCRACIRTAIAYLSEWISAGCSG